MATEIERKFLVKEQLLPESTKQTEMVQAYLNEDPGRTVRVRIAGTKAFLTIKGEMKGFSRAEFEYEIPIQDAHEMMGMAVHEPVRKVRHIIIHAGKHWEVDFFSGKNEGLIVAELELSSEDESVDFPEWIGQEVTGDNRFHNSQLSKNPYLNW